MNEQLIIRLGSKAEQPICWLVWSELIQEIIASGEISSASELSALAERLGQRPVVALVPAADVVLKKVALPAKPTKQLLQALPYMLEEEQAEDIDKLYIALGKAELVSGQYLQQVALCQRQRLEQWLDWLHTGGFSVSRLLPDALLLPTDTLPNCIAIHDQWLLRQELWQATAIERDWWSDYLQLAALPVITSYSPWPIDIPQQHQSANPELPLALLARGLSQTDFNLLQGAYAPKRRQNQHWVQWRLSVGLLAACVVLYVGQLALQVWQQQQQLTQLEQQLRTEFQQVFPAERITNLSRQVQQKLQNTGGVAEQQHFMSLLAALQLRLEALPDLRLDSLRYDASRQELRFAASAAGFPSFEQLKHQLEQAGYSVEQGALSNDGNRVQGSVVMRGKL